MDRETLSLLGFSNVLNMVKRLAQSSLGESRISKIRPMKGRREIEERLALLDECVRYRQEQGTIDLHELEDPRDTLENARVEGAVLEPKDLLLVLKILKLGRRIRKATVGKQWPHISQCMESLPFLNSLAEEIERVIDPDGIVSETADPELAKIRAGLAKCRQKIQQHLGEYLTDSHKKYLIEEPYITLRNHRYVIPVKVRHQNELPGVVHARSSSGATLFLEPFTVVSLNNQFLCFQEEEQSIIQKILKMLTKGLREHYEECRYTVEKIAEIDALFAVVEFSLRYDCVIPRLTDDGVIYLKDARHPLLVDELGQELVVPISLELGVKGKALVISGPNTGGKTVALKTIGLFSLMAQSGLPVMASDVELPVFKQVLADIGDHQSISDQLSTFSSHILRIKRVAEIIDSPSLVLLDEIGRGTDSSYGGALGIAAIDFFIERNTKVVVTTHQDSIKSYALSTEGVENACVKLDPETLSPTFQLEMGVAGGSSGLDIAGQLGLPLQIVEKAKKFLSADELQAERYLEQLRDQLEVVGKKQAELDQRIGQSKEYEEQLKIKFEEKQKKLWKITEKKIEQLSNDFARETQHFVKSIKDRFEASRAKKEAKQKQALLREAFQSKMASERKAESRVGTHQRVDKDIEQGSWAYHSFFQKTGQVLAIKGEEIILEIEGKKIRASIDQLQPVEEEQIASRQLPKNIALNVVRDKDRELNLIGLRVEEALIRTDKFLDRAFVSDLKEVRIIHGLGTGKLSAALSDFLSQHSHVAEYSLEGSVTIVSLRE